MRGHEHEGHERTRSTATHHDHAQPRAPRDGIEWEDDMVEVNRMTTPANMRWKLDRPRDRRGERRDRLAFSVGDQVKIRLVNEMDSATTRCTTRSTSTAPAASCPRPRRRRRAEPGLEGHGARAAPGETVDILLDVTNPGRWMAHCHIAEHHESGMMFSFNVDPVGAESHDRAAGAPRSSDSADRVEARSRAAPLTATPPN